MHAQAIRLAVVAVVLLVVTFVVAFALGRSARPNPAPRTAQLAPCRTLACHVDRRENLTATFMRDCTTILAARAPNRDDERPHVASINLGAQITRLVKETSRFAPTCRRLYRSGR